MRRLIFVSSLFAAAVACTTVQDESGITIAYLKSRCGDETTDALYCFELGKRFLEGRGTDRDPVTARRYFERACELNLTRGCHNLALMQREGLGGPEDEDAAGRLFQKACDRSNGPSCVQSAGLVLTAPGDMDTPIAESALSKACLLGYPQACNGYALFAVSKGNSAKNEAAAWRGYYAACEGGKNEACDRLRALEVDPRSTMTSACQEGDGAACHFLGTLLDNGKFGPRDKEGARRYYERACRFGISVACNDLGEMWAKGRGGAASMEKAESLFDSACRKDGLVGCANLAVLKEWNGDLEEARMLRERACYNGHAASCERLSWFWSWGWGGRKESVRAEVLLGQACDLGDEKACRVQKGGSR